MSSYFLLLALGGRNWANASPGLNTAFWWFLQGRGLLCPALLASLRWCGSGAVSPLPVLEGIAFSLIIIISDVSISSRKMLIERAPEFFVIHSVISEDRQGLIDT